jgi:glutaminyl-tRNA synthetase
VLNLDSLVVAEGARIEPALAAADAGSRWQFLRQGYFHVDPVDSKPGAPVFNRIIALKDTWAGRGQEERSGRDAERARAPEAAAPTSSARKTTRPSSPATRPADMDEETARRFHRYRGELGLGEREADRIARDPTLAVLFEGALAVHTHPPSVARWVVNDLAGLANERDTATLPIGGAELGRFVAIVDAGRVTQAAAKTLLASLVERGGDPDVRLRELGLEKVEDRGVVEQAVAAVFGRHAVEVARYRAGEAKLLGFLLGAAMRETQGAADPAVVREVLQARLRDA